MEMLFVVEIAAAITHQSFSSRYSDVPRQSGNARQLHTNCSFADRQYLQRAHALSLSPLADDVS